MTARLDGVIEAADQPPGEEEYGQDNITGVVLFRDNAHLRQGPIPIQREFST